MSEQLSSKSNSVSVSAMQVGGGEQLLKDSETWAKPAVKVSLKSSASCLTTVKTQKGTGKQNRKAKE